MDGAMSNPTSEDSVALWRYTTFYSQYLAPPSPVRCANSLFYQPRSAHSIPWRLQILTSTIFSLTQWWERGEATDAQRVGNERRRHDDDPVLPSRYYRALILDV